MDGLPRPRRECRHVEWRLPRSVPQNRDGRFEPRHLAWWRLLARRKDLGPQRLETPEGERALQDRGGGCLESGRSPTVLLEADARWMDSRRAQLRNPATRRLGLDLHRV